ncbi:exosortase/archaeosortase family protein [Aquisphaera insulae]|uniref:exosortase/archaeosortase family protein n=1 Tax=Aquisphaera insulae TaxID=2712864 RepID=UPI0013EDD1F1|nr:exosortase/archaeosortase family protein [Aquisphaera insulae]
MPHLPSLNADAMTPTSRLAPLQRLRAAEPRLIAAAVGLASLTWAYWPNLQGLYDVWTTEPNYSHGILVIPIALLIGWQRMGETKEERAGETVGYGPWWSWALLASTLAVRAAAYEKNSQWVETVTLIPAVASLLLIIGGWPLLRRLWPAVAFLLFMLPLPRTVNQFITMPLQRLATMGSVFIMLLTGLLVKADGNIIHVPDAPPQSRTLEVAQACNGLSMLMTLAATVTATVILFPMPNWKRIVILASALPIALISNIIRIVATGWCYYLTTGESAHRIAHDWAGYLMMPTALILVGLELLILTWLSGGEEAEAEQPRPVFAIIPPAQDFAGVKKKGREPEI